MFLHIYSTFPFPGVYGKELFPNQFANKRARDDNPSICWYFSLKLNMICEQARSKFLNTVLLIFCLEKIENLFCSYTVSVTFSIVSSGVNFCIDSYFERETFISYLWLNLFKFLHKLKVRVYTPFTIKTSFKLTFQSFTNVVLRCIDSRKYWSKRTIIFVIFSQHIHFTGWLPFHLQLVLCIYLCKFHSCFYNLDFSRKSAQFT